MTRGGYIFQTFSKAIYLYSVVVSDEILSDSESLCWREVKMSRLKRAQTFGMILGYFSCTKAHNTLTGKEVIPSFSGSHAHGFLRK